LKYTSLSGIPVFLIRNYDCPRLACLQVASALEKILGAPALLVPFGQSSDACHLANERLQRINLMHGKNVIKHLLYMLEDAGSL
jgi:di- and tripeptidase/Cys-Gly metallodipeptidase DUG1